MTTTLRATAQSKTVKSDTSITNLGSNLASKIFKGAKLLPLAIGMSMAVCSAGANTEEPSANGFLAGGIIPPMEYFKTNCTLSSKINGERITLAELELSLVASSANNAKRQFNRATRDASSVLKNLAGGYDDQTPLEAYANSIWESSGAAVKDTKEDGSEIPEDLSSTIRVKCETPVVIEGTDRDTHISDLTALDELIEEDSVFATESVGLNDVTLKLLYCSLDELININGSLIEFSNTWNSDNSILTTLINMLPEHATFITELINLNDPFTDIDLDKLTSQIESYFLPGVPPTCQSDM